MAISFERKAYGGGKPIFWRGDCKVLPGGYKLMNDLPVGTIIDKGTPLIVGMGASSNPNRMYAVALLSFLILSTFSEDDGSGFSVGKGHPFVAGSSVILCGINGEKVGIATVASVDSSDPDKDKIIIEPDDRARLSEAFFAVLLPHASYAELPNKAPILVPNACAAAELVIDGKGDYTIDAAYEALIIKNNTPFVVPSLNNAGMCWAGNPSIKYINQ